MEDNIIKIPPCDLTNKVLRLNAKTEKEISHNIINIVNHIDYLDRVILWTVISSMKTITDSIFILSLSGGNLNTIEQFLLRIITKHNKYIDINMYIPIVEDSKSSSENRLYNLDKNFLPDNMVVKDILLDNNINNIIYYNVGTEEQPEYIIKVPNGNCSNQKDSRVLILDENPDTDANDYPYYTIFSLSTKTIWRSIENDHEFYWVNKGSFSDNIFINDGSISFKIVDITKGSYVYFNTNDTIDFYVKITNYKI